MLFLQGGSVVVGTLVPCVHGRSILVGAISIMAGEMRARGGDVQAKTSETPCLMGATALPPRTMH